MEIKYSDLLFDRNYLNKEGKRRKKMFIRIDQRNKNH